MVILPVGEYSADEMRKKRLSLERLIEENNA